MTMFSPSTEAMAKLAAAVPPPPVSLSRRDGPRISELDAAGIRDRVRHGDPFSFDRVTAVVFTDPAREAFAQAITSGCLTVNATYRRDRYGRDSVTRDEDTQLLADVWSWYAKAAKVPYAVVTTYVIPSRDAVTVTDRVPISDGMTITTKVMGYTVSREGKDWVLSASRTTTPADPGGDFAAIVITPPPGTNLVFPGAMQQALTARINAAKHHGQGGFPVQSGPQGALCQRVVAADADAVVQYALAIWAHLPDAAKRGEAPPIATATVVRDGSGTAWERLRQRRATTGNGTKPLP
jgi:hypothetical protein